LQAHHLVALAHFDQAKTVLDWVTREAASSLRIQHGDGHGGDPDWEHFAWRSAPDYWVCFELPVGARVDHGWLEISLAPWTHLDGEIRFGAGLVIEEPNRASKADATVMVEADFDHVHQYHERFYRFKHPGELLAAQTPDAQVELLRDWVQESFGAVERALRNRPFAAPSA
jgi:hypothetical protein